MLRRRKLQLWLGKKLVRWHSVSELLANNGTRGLFRRFLDWSYITMPKGGMKKITADLCTLNGIISSSTYECLACQVIDSGHYNGIKIDDEIDTIKKAIDAAVCRKCQLEPYADNINNDIKKLAEEYIIRGTTYSADTGSTIKNVETLLQAKQEIQDRRCRKNMLHDALAKVGCTFRNDSKLCHRYLHKHIYPTFNMNADEIAHKMAYMKWLHEHVNIAYKKKIEETVHDIALQNNDDDEYEQNDGFYSGIYLDVAKKVQQLPEFQTPSKWPWLLG